MFLARATFKDSAASSSKYLILMLLIVAGYLAITLHIIYFKLPEFLSYRGWSLSYLLNAYFHPALFSNNFPDAGQTWNTVSLFSRFFMLLSFIGVPDQTLEYLQPAINLCCYFGMCYLVLRIFSAKQSIELIVFTILVTIYSQIRLGSFDGFNILYLAGQSPYPSAYLFSTVGIFFLFRRHLYLAAVFLALAVDIHFIIGFFGCLFALISHLDLLKKLEFRKNILLPLSVFLVITVGWIFCFLPTANHQFMSIQDWLAFGKIACFHWYPINNGFFSSQGYAHIIPFISFTLLLSHFLFDSRIVQDAELRNRLLVAYGLLIILVILGCLFSLSTSPLLITLALHRANPLFFLFGAPLIAYGFWITLLDPKEGFFTKGIVACLILSIFLKNSHGFPLILACVLLIRYFKKNKYPCAYVAGLVSIPSLFLLLQVMVPGVNYTASGSFLGISLNDLAALVQPIKEFLYSSHFISHKATKKLLPFVAGSYLCFFVICSLALSVNKRYLRSLFLVVLSYPALMSFAYAFGAQLKPDEVMRYENLYQVEMWAKNSTPINTIFMKPPEERYGWSDYSLRPSVGVLHDWIFASWAYSRSLKTFEFSMRMVNSFGVNLEPYLAYENLDGYRSLSQTIGSIYYKQSPAWFKQMEAEFGIKYFVLETSKITNQDIITTCKLAYRNDFYSVCNF